MTNCIHTTPPSLPLDCLEEILGYLTEDRNTLYSCILSTRLFCKLSIPLLWLHPFRVKPTHSKSHTIIQVLLSSLPEVDRQQLIKEGIKLPANLPEPLFEYPKYIQGLDTGHFQMTIYQWMNAYNKFNKLNRSYFIGFMGNIIGNHLFGISRGIKTLILNYDVEYSIESIMNISTYTGIESSLGHLRELKIKTKNAQDIDFSLEIFIITRYATQIRQIIIDTHYIIDELLYQAISSLVSIQKNLCSLKLAERWVDAATPLIYKAIQTQSESLKTLELSEFRNLQALLSLLSNCPNLETLFLTEHFSIPNAQEMFDSINYLPPIHIKHLKAYNILFPKISDFTLMIQTLIQLSSKHLNTIMLQFSDSNIISNIGQYCPQIRFLSLTITFNEFCSLYSTLPFLTSLDYLHLVFAHIEGSIGYTNDPVLPSDESLEKLAKSFPSRLKYLAVYFGIPPYKRTIFDLPHSLSKILCNIKNPLEKLDIYNEMDSRLMRVIVDYATEIGGLKKLGIVEGWTNEEWFEQSKGVIEIIVNVEVNGSPIKFNSTLQWCITETLPGILSEIKIPFPPPLLDQDLLPKIKKGKLPLRTTNPFLLYRTALIKTLFKKGYYEYNMRDISKLASKLWKLEPEYVQREYRSLALKVKKIHREYELDSIQRDTRMDKVDVIRVHRRPRDCVTNTTCPDDTHNLSGLDYYNYPSEIPSFYNPPSLEFHGEIHHISNSHNVSHVNMFNAPYYLNHGTLIMYPIHNLVEPNIEQNQNINYDSSYEQPVGYTVNNQMEPNIEQNIDMFNIIHNFSPDVTKY
ncbi:598_t:CDS:2 [Acaulospora morrowiae]|uniref:598_t:CDS:1 n=1 Tax=Acaulospora morrowiae TaxID=94023 RepID=A0A9N8VQU3_9GLOM|nr:598_t:CDS:2 [Acaulospora morrowiae]